MAVQYYALVLNTRTVDNPFRVFREIRGPGVYRMEAYDPKSGEWVKDADFAAYTLFGEIGAEPISKATRPRRSSRGLAANGQGVRAAAARGAQAACGEPGGRA